jgi:NAD(P)H-hydrate repair Nnr-like enzyme with NAD(P)H-hydrate dehydratase domain
LICTLDTKDICSTPGSLRRIGGQGDIMAGCIATFLAWAKIYTRNPDNQPLEYSIGHLSAFGGADLMRASAFEVRG